MQVRDVMKHVPHVTRHTSHVTPTAACFAADKGEGAASSWDVACVREFGLDSATVRYRFGAD